MRVGIGSAIGALMLVTSLCLPAEAAKHLDPNDTQGKLDLRSVSVDRFQASGTAYVLIDFKTYDPFKLRIFRGLDPAGFVMSFDTKGGSSVDYRVRFKVSIVSGPYCELVGRWGKVIATTSATKGRSGMACSVKRRLLGITKTPRWKSFSFYLYYTDHVPNRGWIKGLR